VRRSLPVVLRVIAIVGVVATTVMVTAEAAMACTCAPMNPKKALASSKGAVTARLLEKSGEDFVYRTGRVVKGEARRLQQGRRLVVRSHLLCGLEGDVGALTGLFLYRESGGWISGLCNQISRGQMLRLSRGGAADGLRYKTASCLGVVQRHPGRTVGSGRLTW
jgi:hypothetical protein